MNKPLVTYINPPEKCDWCEAPIESEFYDARTLAGPWGNLCPLCFKQHGRGLGPGRGQHFVRQPNGQFIKIGG